MLKRIIAFFMSFLIVFSIVLPAFAAHFEEVSPLLPIPYNFRKLDLREKLITIALSQEGYEEADNGATAYHQDMYGDIPRTSYLYDVPWSTVFLAWVFKKAGIYTPTFQQHSSTNVKTLAYLFMTNGQNKEKNLSYAFFDPEYFNQAKAGDLVFFDWKRKEGADYSDIAKKKVYRHVGLITKVEKGTLTVVSGDFKNQVWVSDLSTSKNLHSPYRVLGFGVLDKHPEKDLIEGVPLPILSYEKASGKQMIIYYLYKDGTCLTSNGLRDTEDFLIDIKANLEEKSTKKLRANYYKNSYYEYPIASLPDRVSYYILGEENNRVQILFQSTMLNGKEQFPIFESVWIDKSDLNK